MFDDRLLRVGIMIGDKMHYYEDLAMRISGSKTTNDTINEATVQIINLDKNKRDTILAATTPYRAQPSGQLITVEAGRKSYGYTTVFKGQIFRSTISQPPDINLSLKCMSGFDNMLEIQSVSMGESAPLSQICKKVADSTGLKLTFEATDRNIANFSYIGSKLKQIDVLNKIGGISAYQDDDKLVVKNSQQPLANTNFIINESSGMIGVPELTEVGIKVKVLFDPRMIIGSQITIESKINTAANGTYEIFKQSFDLANRDSQFYYILEGSLI